MAGRNCAEIILLSYDGLESDYKHAVINHAVEYVNENVHTNTFENYGVPPDVYVDNAPSDFLSGHDRQIEKAIEVLRSEMR